MLYIKALHIIFVVTWFSGLFYIVRLFVYHSEAETKAELEKKILQEQFKIMERRLWYGITWPSLVGTFIFGFWLMYLNGNYTSPWLLAKLSLVAGLFIYHMICGRVLNQLHKNSVRYTTGQLRMWNEVATLFLVSIVFIVVLKNNLNAIGAIAGITLLGIALFYAIRIYKQIREGK